MDVFDAIRLRRSIKPDKLSPQPVPRAVLEQLLEAANWAPSHGLTEPWRFIVFEGEARRALAEAAVSTMAAPGEGTLPLDDPRRVKLLHNMLSPPVTIAIVCAPSKNPKIVREEEVISTGIAVHNLTLAARALGIATFWTSGEKATHAKMAEFLGLEPGSACLGFLYVGYPAVPWPDATRGPIAPKVTWRA